jgi:hypothetical protein
MMTLAIPAAMIVGNLASPASDLSWLAPLGFAAALWMVVLVAKGITRDRDSRVDAPETAPAELRRAA